MGLNLIHTEDNSESIEDRRWGICNSCKLLKHTDIGPMCNSKLYLNVQTNDISTTPKSGYKRGCGCFLKHKIKQTYSKCPLSKW